MRDELSLGTVPVEESCEQLGANYNPIRSCQECAAFINQLKRMHGVPPGKARYKITSNPHDFGTYHDVVIEFDESSKKEASYAYKVESDLPFTWDDKAMMELCADSFITLVKGETISGMDTLRSELVLNGYVEEEQATKPGYFSIRGGIIDIFSYGRSFPVRIELFGNDVETIRHYDEKSSDYLMEAEKFEVYLRIGN